MLLPPARVAPMPATVRSRIMERWNSAIAASTWNTIRPAADFALMFSVTERNPICRFRSLPMI